MDPAGDERAGDRTDYVSAALVRNQVARILRSPSFLQVPTLGRLLHYLAEHTVAGDPGQLKEYAVGLEVFGRGAAFDPRTDTIVRVHARRLRRRLEQYYASDGHADPILVEVPKGHYLVRWRRAPSRATSSSTPDGFGSIVVLPFANFGGDASDEYLADGLTEEIICALAALPDLHVVARTSAFQFKQGGHDVRDIGKTLGVQFALEGSIRRDGQSIRVVAQLIDTHDGFHRWSRTYDRDLTSTFKLQEEISGAIADTLSDRLGRRASAVRGPAPAVADALDCHLKARYFWNKATPDDAAKATRYWQQAIALDPAYAAAHAGLADAFVFLATVECDAPGPLMERARQAAQSALDLDDLAEGHVAMGAVMGMGDWNWSGAEREFRRALDLMPSFAHARGAYAMGCLAPLGRYDEAVDQLRQAVRLDPLSVFLRTMLSQTLVLAGRSDEAVHELQTALELDGQHGAAIITLALAHIGCADFARAIDVLEGAPAPAKTFPNFAGHLGYAHGRLGHVERAKSLAEALLSRFPGPWVPGVDVGAIYNGLGDTPAAMHWLERARDLRSFDVTFVTADPRFTNLMSDPRLERLVSAIASS